jgi:outer membrane receptor for ferrienterochelin and colicins
MKEYKIAFIGSILLFINTICINSQYRTLKGTVTDEEGRPVTNVLVTAKGTELSASTDKDGNYLLESVPDSIITLTFSHPDMETASATIGIYEKIDVTMSKMGSSELLEVSIEDLLNMDVTIASRSSEKLSDAPGVVSVVTKDELERFGGTTLKDILERVPSLIGSTVYMTDRSTIAPRGDQIQASSSHVLLLINGRPVREALEGGIKSEIYESFPVNIIEKIEVIRGPGSVLYGSNAVSAVINVITENAEENNVGVTGLIGGSGAFGALAEAKLKLGDINVIAAGRIFKKADWELDWTYAVPTSPAGDTTIRVNNPNEGPGAYLEMSYKNLRFMGAYSEWKNYYYIADYAFIFPSYGNAFWKKGFGDLGYSIKASDKWDMDFNVTYTRSTFETSSWPNTSRNSYETVAEWTNFINPTEKFGIVFGGLFNYIHGEEDVPDLGKVSDDSRSNIGIYSQMDFQLLESLKLIGGVQANKVENIDLDIVPRGGVIWYPFKRLNIKALYSQAFRAPSINEVGLNFPEMQGNPDLVPEKVNTVDIGVNYQGVNSQAGVNYFYSKQTDIIFQDRSDAFPVPTYNNGQEVTIQGVEFEGKYYISRSLFVTASMLYQKNEDKEENENVTPIPNLGAKAGISYKSDDGLAISLFNIYQGDLDEKYNTQVNPSPEAYNLMNFYCRYNLNKWFGLSFMKDLSLFLQIDNLLDEEIWLPDWGLVIGKSMPVNQGRAIYFGINAAL